MAIDEMKEPLLEEFSTPESNRGRKKDGILRRPIFGVAAIFLLMALPIAIFKPDIVGSCRMLMQGTGHIVVNIGIEPNVDDGELYKREAPSCPAAPATQDPPKQEKPVSSPTSPAASNVCTNSVCVEYAKQIKSNMASNYKEVDPCTNFDEYVCKGWQGNHDYRADQSAVEVASVMQDTIRNLLHGVLESPYSTVVAYEGENKTADVANFAKLKTSYDACMNQDAIKAYGVAPITKLLADLEAHFPAVWNGTDCNEELTATHLWLAAHGVSGLVSMGINGDDKDPDLQVISLSGGEYALPSKEYYNQTGTVANYTKAISQQMQIITTGNTFGTGDVPIPETGDYSMAWAKKIIDLENRIIHASPDPVVANKPEYYYKPTDIGAIVGMVEGLQMRDFVQKQVPAAYTVKTVILSDPYYYGNLSAIIKETPRDVLHSYFRWNLVRSWQGRIHKDYNRPMRRFNNLLAGRDPEAITDRWRTCISEVDNISGGLGWIESAVFAQRAFSQRDKNLGDNIVKDLRAEFVNRLKTFPWMSDSVKAAATRKVTKIFQKIGYPTASPDISNPIALRDFYAELEPTDNYFHNGEAWLKRSQKKARDALLKPTDRAEWGMSVPTINAYYNSGLNEIVFPAGIMQIPVFAAELPDYVSYGSFGSVAGHEITHGFDNNGAKYDENGRYNEWWDAPTTSNFKNLTHCFVDQFAKYSIIGPEGNKINVNGDLTLGENIADAGGISASYAAWQRRHAASPNPSLPGLEEFTPEQMFFIAYGTWWCGKVRPAQAENWIYTDVHSPADARIKGTTANSAGFREAFNCPVKEPTCVLW